MGKPRERPDREGLSPPTTSPVLARITRRARPAKTRFRPGGGSYQTAWAWLHKLRRAMVLPGRELLSGTVEVDETYVAAYERWRP